MQTLGDLVKKGTSGGLFCKMILDGKTFSYTFRESVKKVINNVVNECGSRESNTIFIPEKEVLSICSIIKKSREQDSVIIFDEPEARLHPAAVSDLLDIIMLLAENGIQIFIASHSYFVLKKSYLLARQNNMSIPILSLDGDTSADIHYDDLCNGLPENAIMQESTRLYEEEIDEVL